MRNNKITVFILFTVLFMLTGQNINTKCAVFAQNSSKISAPKVSGSIEKNTANTIPQKAKKFSNPLLDPNNPLGLTFADNSISKTYSLIQQNKLTEAKALIEPVLNWLEDATEYHTNIYKTLNEINTAKSQADLEREIALQFAVMRDKALYQMALLYIEEKKFPKAVEKLVNVVRSQPTTQLGFSAYQVLQQIGFTYKVQLPETNSQEKTD